MSTHARVEGESKRLKTEEGFAGHSGVGYASRLRRESLKSLYGVCLFQIEEVSVDLSESSASDSLFQKSTLV